MSMVLKQLYIRAHPTSTSFTFLWHILSTHSLTLEYEYLHSLCDQSMNLKFNLMWGQVHNTPGHLINSFSHVVVIKPRMPNLINLIIICHFWAKQVILAKNSIFLIFFTHFCKYLTQLLYTVGISKVFSDYLRP